ncbi:MAG: BsaA family SipW-dependent biofilm matrix protein [Oscillospiraceae bacterium]|jgi:hypothetical protein|nr:BsaA family SipW-dependent biofilm matrix protein [Oscillospiraceae bacterium]
MKRKNKSLILALAVVLAVITALSGATFAWFTSKDTVKNHLETVQLNDGDVSIREVFTPPDDWYPGQEVNKDVGVVNTGDTDAVVRVSFEEVLAKLTTGTTVGADHKYGTVPAEDVGYVPQVINVAPYATWLPITDGVLDIASFGTQSDVTVLYKKTVISGSETSYSFVAYSTAISGLSGEYTTKYNGKHQRVSVTFEVERGTGAGGKDRLIGLVSKYGVYAWGITERNWSSFTPKVTSVGVTSPASTAFTAGPPLTIFATSDAGEKLQLIFATGVSTVLANAVGANSWWYNQADGYFYYTKKLAAGTATPDLLDAVKLLSSAGPAYSSLAFDLYVHMDGIQATRAAVNAADGWNLSTVTYADLYAALGLTV